MIRTTQFRCLLLWLTVVVVVVFTAAEAVGEDPTFEGLIGVRVKVDVDPSLSEEGLSAKQIQSDVESRLQRDNVPVLSEEQWRQVEHHPLLYLQIQGERVQENWKFYTFSIHIYLLQDVTLVRESGTIRHQAATWFTGIAGHGYFGDIQTRVNELVDRFTAKFPTG